VCKLVKILDASFSASGKYAITITIFVLFRVFNKMTIAALFPSLVPFIP